mgnify:CR=1 FL=1
MHITFVHNNYENLGIEYISSYLKIAHYQTSLVFEPGLFGSFFAHNKKVHRLLNFKKEIIEKITFLKPDLIGFSVISDNYAWACDLASEIKKRFKVLIVFGGIHPTSVPKHILDLGIVDFVIRGEGEEAFLELVEALDKGKKWMSIRNLAFKKNGHVVVNPLRPAIGNLDTLPFPDKDLFFKEYEGLVNKAYMTMASRGCIYSCSYCVNSILNDLYPHHSYFRKRSVDHVIDELLWAKQRYDIKRVTFYDEDFIINERWLKEFLQRYKTLIKLPFFCCIHPSHLDEETVYLLDRAGCAAVNIGIQTYSENYRKNILNRYGNNAEIAASLRLLKNTKIFVYSNVMLGLPGQTEEEVLKTLEFCATHKSDIASIYWLRYYPKTPLIDTARKMKVLSEKDILTIEESREYNPYAIKGNTFNKRVSKIGNVILMSSFLPLAIVRFIIKTKCYRWAPSKNLLFSAIALIGIGKKLFRGKKNPFHYFGIIDYFKFYLFYLKKKLLFGRSH